MQKLMAHLVAGYKTDEYAFNVARALVKGGAEILEVQLPFSDPSADGVAIQGACCQVLKNGYSTKEGLALIKRITSELGVSVFLMSYGSLVFTPGVDNFCAMARDAGVSGLIIPDLPFDCDEGLLKSCKKYGLHDIIVAAPSMTKDRIDVMGQWLKSSGAQYLYAALRVGITGGKTVIDSTVTDFLKLLKPTSAKVLGGFGIQTGEQARLVAPYVEYVVAGSVFVNLIASGSPIEAISNKAKELCS